MADTDLEFERTMPVPSSDQRVLAAVFYLGWIVGLWPEAIAFIAWWLRGKPRFVIAHAAQWHVFGGLIAPIFLVGVTVQSACGLVATITGDTRRFLMPGALAMAASGAAWLGLVLLQSAIGAFQAFRGRTWADPLCRALARSVRAAKADCVVPETERLLAACSYFSFCVAVGAFLWAPKSSKHVRLHAIQGALVSSAWGFLEFALIFLAASWTPHEPNDRLECGPAVAVVATFPILAVCVALAMACFRGGRRAARGDPFRLPIASAIAERIA